MYDVAVAQQNMKKPLVQHLLGCNKSVAELAASSDRGLTFKPGLKWESSILLIIADSSHGGEHEWIDEWEVREPFRSQGAGLIALADPAIAEGRKGTFHPIAFGTGIVPRVCRSTIQAEGYNLDLKVEHAHCIRAGLADLHGKLDIGQNGQHWETSAA
eukprot:5510774-Karenia_brevis.AAC.1